MSDSNTDDDDEILLAQDVVHNVIKSGDELNISDKDPTLKNALLAIGWDLKAFEGDPLDLDASLFLLDKNDQTRIDNDFIFYNNPSGCDGAIKHKGDNRTGAGDGDDEVISLDLNGISFDIIKIVIVLSIYDDGKNDHDFTGVKNVYFRLANEETDHEIFRYQLDDNLGKETAIVIGALERIGPKWIFRAMDDQIEGGLASIATDYGIIVAENVQA